MELGLLHLVTGASIQVGCVESTIPGREAHLSEYDEQTRCRQVREAGLERS